MCVFNSSEPYGLITEWSWDFLNMSCASIQVCVQCMADLLSEGYCARATLIKKKRKFSSYIRKFRWKRLQSNIWLTAFSYMVQYLRILGSPSSYMTLQPPPSEFPNIYEVKFLFSFFISVTSGYFEVLQLSAYYSGTAPQRNLLRIFCTTFAQWVYRRSIVPRMSGTQGRLKKYSAIGGSRGPIKNTWPGGGSSLPSLQNIFVGKLRDHYAGGSRGH